MLHLRETAKIRGLRELDPRDASPGKQGAAHLRGREEGVSRAGREVLPDVGTGSSDRLWKDESPVPADGPHRQGACLRLWRGKRDEVFCSEVGSFWARPICRHQYRAAEATVLVVCWRRIWKGGKYSTKAFPCSSSNALCPRRPSGFLLVPLYSVSFLHRGWG